jgi:hypothetical protein
MEPDEELDPDPLVRGTGTDPPIRTKMSRIPNAVKMELKLLTFLTVCVSMV